MLQTTLFLRACMVTCLDCPGEQLNLISGTSSAVCGTFVLEKNNAAKHPELGRKLLQYLLALSSLQQLCEGSTMNLKWLRQHHCSYFSLSFFPKVNASVAGG